MGSVSSVNPGVADLLQTLTSLNSPVMSSSTAVTALEKASPSDIVQLSVAAIQLQGVDTMFGISTGSSSSSSTNMSTVLANLGNSLAGAAETSANGQTGSAAEQLANYQAVLQGAETQGLFGVGNTIGLSGSLFNTIA
jgi:hypothetical protein